MCGSKFRNEEQRSLQMPSNHQLGVAVREQHLAPAQVLLAPTEPEKLPQSMYRRNLLRTHMAHSALNRLILEHCCDQTSCRFFEILLRNYSALLAFIPIRKTTLTGQRCSATCTFINMYMLIKKTVIGLKISSRETKNTTS